MLNFMRIFFLLRGVALHVWTSHTCYSLNTEDLVLLVLKRVDVLPLTVSGGEYDCAKLQVCVCLASVLSLRNLRKCILILFFSFNYYFLEDISIALFLLR